MGCPPVCGLSYVQMDKHGITILFHLHQCRPCKSQNIHAKVSKGGINLDILQKFYNLIRASLHKNSFNIINPCPAEPGFISFFENTVDPDQMASDEAI